MGDVNTMVTHIAKGDLSKAQTEFEDMMADRVQARIDQEKVAVASNVFNPGDEIEDDELRDIVQDFDIEDSEDEEIEDDEDV